MSAVVLNFLLRKLSTVSINNSSVLICKKNRLETCRQVMGNFRTANFTTSKITLKDCADSPHASDDNKKKKGKVFIRHDGVEVKRKMPEGPKILVIDLMGSKTSMYMENAEKIAKHNKWRLEFVGEKNDKKIYKFTSDHSDRIVLKSDTKRVSLSSKISLHDVDVKISNISKLIKKRKNVYVIIQGTSNDKAEMEKVWEHIKKGLGTDVNVTGLKNSKSSISFLVKASERSLEQNESGDNPVENKENQNSDNLNPSNLSI